MHPDVRIHPPPTARRIATSTVAGVLALIVITAGLPGCATDVVGAGESVPVTMAELAPAAYAGEIPCADCPGIRVELELRTNGMYLLRRTWITADNGNDRSAVTIGRWGVEPDSRQLALRSGTDPVERFAVDDHYHLRMLDGDGRDIRSDLNYSLARSRDTDLFNDPFALRGHYFYLADAAIFTECQTGKRFDVITSPVAAELERAYMEAVGDSGNSVVVSVEARLTKQPNPDTGTPHDAIAIQRIIGLHAGEDCEPGSRHVTLTGTTWNFVEVAGKTVTVREGDIAPHLVLERSESEAGGFAGCNRFFGTYTRSLDSLSLGSLGSTRKSCKRVMETEQAILAALEKTTRFRIEGERLILRSRDGELAVLTASLAPPSDTP
ncbi:MAG: META domain-containing protein [Myxococcales bacterium]|jgi:copper homeostasis protein (lipoprotein)|nr:MAG: META domain-containing protein [Myxococcales bacterium]